LATIPIIAVTANAMKGDAQKALEAGCNLYMSKPISIQDLIEKVKKLVYKEA
jgi:CheY-like chemotaxis protein